MGLLSQVDKKTKNRIGVLSGCGTVSTVPVIVPHWLVIRISRRLQGTMGAAADE